MALFSKEKDDRSKDLSSFILSVSIKLTELSLNKRAWIFWRRDYFEKRHQEIKKSQNISPLFNQTVGFVYTSAAAETARKSPKSAEKVEFFVQKIPLAFW